MSTASLPLVNLDEPDPRRPRSIADLPLVNLDGPGAAPRSMADLPLVNLDEPAPAPTPRGDGVVTRADGVTVPLNAPPPDAPPPADPSQPRLGWLSKAIASATGVSDMLNRVTDSAGTVGGGVNNQAGDNAGSAADKPAELGPVAVGRDGEVNRHDPAAAQGTALLHPPGDQRHDLVAIDRAAFFVDHD
jgi:hypothetical protein